LRAHAIYSIWNTSCCTVRDVDDVLRSLEAVVVGSVALTARALADAGSELTLVQWRVLVVLEAADTPLTIGEVARRAGASPSAMSRLVGRLMRRGYVSSRGGRRDRRERRITVTDGGRALVSRIVAARDRELAQLRIASSDAPALGRLGDAFGELGERRDE
jgi:DNA-binding MarR family transcriptional regulator